MDWCHCFVETGGEDKGGGSWNTNRLVYRWQQEVNTKHWLHTVLSSVKLPDLSCLAWVSDVCLLFPAMSDGDERWTLESWVMWGRSVCIILFHYVLSLCACLFLDSRQGYSCVCLCYFWDYVSGCNSLSCIVLESYCYAVLAIPYLDFS